MRAIVPRPNRTCQGAKTGLIRDESDGFATSFPQEPSERNGEILRAKATATKPLALHLSPFPNHAITARLSQIQAEQIRALGAIRTLRPQRKRCLNQRSIGTQGGVAMSTHSVRFVHASDLHLEKTLGGLTSVPTWLRDDFIDAPFKAAENVFEVAIKEDADFLVLSGDVLDIETAGPRAIDFLLSQFQRLLENKIPVYWCGGDVDDPDLWPVEIALPKNVHLFSTASPQTFEFRRRDRVAATLIGQSRRASKDSRLSDYALSKSQGATIAVAHGEFGKRSLQKQSIDYWALGGRHNEKTLYQEQSAARYTGSPQGFTPEEVGSHGCTIVTVEHGRVSCRNMPTRVIQWHREPLHLAADATRKDLEQSLRNQMNALRSTRRDCLTLVTWAVSCNGPLANDLRNDKVCDTILSAIAQKDGERDGENDIVSVAIENEPHEISDGRFEEETIMGDFLRTVREFESDPNRLIDLAEYLPDTSVRHEVVSALTIATPADRKRILRRVAALGVDLLSGDAETLETQTK